MLFRSPTPAMTPMPSGMNTPQIQTSSLGDYLSAPLGRHIQGKPRSYLAGSKALDSLARMIASTESFFHPSNSGAWTSDVCIILFARVLVVARCLGCRIVTDVVVLSLQLSAFIKFIVFDFNKSKTHSQLLCLSPDKNCSGWHEEQKSDCKTPMVCCAVGHKEQLN